jgi:hypothetical protein
MSRCCGLQLGAGHAMLRWCACRRPLSAVPLLRYPRVVHCCWYWVPGGDPAVSNIVSVVFHAGAILIGCGTPPVIIRAAIGWMLGEALRARPPCGSLALRPSTAFPDRHVRAASSPPLATPAPQGAAAQPLGRTAHPATTTSTARDALRATLRAERPEVRGDAFKGHASDKAAVMAFEPPLAL